MTIPIIVYCHSLKLLSHQCSPLKLFKAQNSRDHPAFLRVNCCDLQQSVINPDKQQE